MTVAVIGAGASGTLAAVALLRADTARALLIDLYETGAIAGRGVAYSTTDPRHLLNVPAERMSMLADEPDHLLRWAEGNALDLGRTGFLPRREYACYLSDTLAAHADDRLTLVPAEVVDIEAVPRHGSKARVTAGSVDAVAGASPGAPGTYAVHTAPHRPGQHLAEHGARITRSADVVVLAYGNLPPRPLEAAGVALPDASWHVSDPWAPGALDDLPRAGDVLLVGTGLTAVDVALTLLEASDGASPGPPARRVIMTSRHGLLHRGHADLDAAPWPIAAPPGDGPLTAAAVHALVGAETARAAAAGVGWRAVIDGIRPITQQLWRRLPLSERRRFLDTEARDWEIHRHRMAPEVAARVDALRGSGRLQVLAGRVASVTPLREPEGVIDEARRTAPATPLGEGCRVVVELPGGASAAYDVAAVVNCTGPLTDVGRSSRRLVSALLARGLVRPDPLRLGVDVDEAGVVTGRAGSPVPGLFAVGPPRKGTLYETTAVPEIREQAHQLAQTLVSRAMAAR